MLIIIIIVVIFFNFFIFTYTNIVQFVDRFIEFKISEKDISDTEFKKILDLLNTKDYSEIQTELNRLIEFPKETIFTLFMHFKEQLTDIGKINIAKALCILPHFFKDSTIEGRMFHRPTRLTLELIEKLESLIKISTLKFILENCERINHAAFIIHECNRGYGKEKELKFEPTAELEIISKDFACKIQCLPIQKLFENVDEEKNDIIFNLIDKYGDIALLKNGLEVFIEQNFENGLVIMKSLIPMTYYNFSSVGEYGHEIGYDRFDAIEYFVSRDLLKKVSLNLFPELEELSNLQPVDHFGKRDPNKNKDIINQYLQFIISKERQINNLLETT